MNEVPAQHRLKKERPRYYFREWRKYRDLTQERLAERTGLTTASISQIENGKQGFTDTTLENLAYALRCNPGDLLMRNPLNDTALWDITDQLKTATREQKNQIRAVVEAILKTGT